MHPPPPVTEHVSLHSKSLWKNMTRASGGINIMHSLSWGTQAEKIQTFFYFIVLSINLIKDFNGLSRFSNEIHFFVLMFLVDSLSLYHYIFSINLLKFSVFQVLNFLFAVWTLWSMSFSRCYDSHYVFNWTYTKVSALPVFNPFCFLITKSR